MLMSMYDDDDYGGGGAHSILVHPVSERFDHHCGMMMMPSHSQQRETCCSEYERRSQGRMNAQYRRTFIASKSEPSLPDSIRLSCVQRIYCFGY